MLVIFDLEVFVSKRRMETGRRFSFKALFTLNAAVRSGSGFGAGYVRNVIFLTGVRI
jgi:hypothetical protein